MSSGVFISYSRRDSAFVEQLRDALARDGRDVWLDREDIPFSAKWLQEVDRGIEGCDAFVFVITPASASSETCRHEAAHAAEHNKRIVPILRQDANASEVPQNISSLNWIPCRDTDDFDHAVSSLIRAIDTDLEWVQAHTRLIVRASEWVRSERDRSLLLRGADLRRAEAWLARASVTLQPAPTNLQIEYIDASRVAERRRRRTLLAVGCLVLIATTVLGVGGWRQRNQARSRTLADTASSVRAADPQLSLLLALEAVRVEPTTEAQRALRDWLAAPHPLARLRLRGSALETCVSFNPDGSRVAGANGTDVELWETGRWETPVTLTGHSDNVNSVVFSPDGKWILTGSDDKTARIWDATTGGTVSVLVGHGGRVRAAAFSPDGRKIVTVSDGNGPQYFHPERRATGDGTLRIWDAVSGKPLDALRLPAEGNAAPVDSPLFELTRGPAGALRLRERHAENGLPIDIAGEAQVFSANGRLMAKGGGSAVLLQDFAGSRQMSLSGHTDDVDALAFTEGDKVLVTGSQDQTVRLWDARTGETLHSFRQGSQVVAVSASPDGSLIAVASTGAIVVWEMLGPAKVTTLRGHVGELTSISFATDNAHVLTSSADGTARLWDVSGKDAVRTLGGHSARVNSAVFSPDGAKVVTASADGSGRIWAASDGRTMATLAHTGSVVGAQFSPDGAKVVTASLDGTARMWAVDSGNELLRLAHGSGVSHALFSSDGAQVITTAGEWIYRWDAVSGRQLAQIHAHKDDLIDVAIASRGNRLVTSSDDHTAKVWNTSTNTATVLQHRDEGVRAAVSPDGALVLTGCEDTRASIWEAESGRRLFELLGHHDILTSVGFGPSGAWALTASQDATARLWDTETGRLAATMRVDSAVRRATFSPDGRLVAIAQANGHATVYSCQLCGSSNDLVRLARSRVTRAFTATERARYLQ